MTKSSKHLARRTELFAAAQDWVGTRFHHQGRGRSGIDCIGLMVRAYAVCGVFLSDNITYGRRPDPVRFMELIREQFDECDADEAEIELFWWNASTRKPQHVGLVNEDLTRIVHTWYGVRRVTDSPRDQLWRERHLSYWKLKEDAWQQ